MKGLDIGSNVRESLKSIYLEGILGKINIHYMKGNLSGWTKP